MFYLFDMVNMRLMMISFMHKHIMDKPSVRYYLNENENIQDFMGNHVFFHDRILDQWIKTCHFDFITKDRGLHDEEGRLQEFCARDYVDYILHKNMSNIHVIINKEET